MMSPRTKAIVVFLIKLGLSVTLLVSATLYLGTEAIQNALRKANSVLILLACVCCVGQVALTTLKWRLLLIDQGIRVSFADLFKMQLNSVFVNVFMPSVLCGDAYRAERLRHHTGSLSSALPSIIVDRGSGLVALLVLGTLALGYVLAPEYLLQIVLIMLGLMSLAYVLLIGPLSRWMEWLSGRRGWAFMSVGSDIANALRPSKTLFFVAAISLFFQFNFVWIVNLCDQAIGLTTNLWHLMATVPAVVMVEMLPISINGVGVREMSFSLLFSELKLKAADGLVLGLTVSIMKYLAGLLCGSIVFFWHIASRIRRGPAIDDGSGAVSVQ